MSTQWPPQWPRITWRDASFTAGGAVLGAAACALLVTGLQWAASPGTQQAEVSAALPVAAVQPSVACPLRPAAAKSGGTDGRFQMPADLGNYGPGDAGAFMVIGKEASAEGRLRDAEVAFLMACRVADRFKGAESVESANARAQLALHYETLLRMDGPGAASAELQRRAELLRPPVVAAPAPAPAAAPAPERPVQTALQPAKPLPPKPEAMVQAKPPPAKPEVALAKPQAPKTAPRAVATVVQHPTSFNCRKARSATEKMICSDAQLARLDSELGWLHARASNSSRNTWAFRQQSEQEWKRREATCRDRECLVRWYTQRRHQLMTNINSG
jgi:hypothetical protein